MIIADSLVKSFANHRAVDGVSFCIERGEVAAVLGPNGAGKSTTLRMLAGVLEPDTGAASIGGLDSAIQRRDAQALLGYLPEGAPAYPAMTPRGFTRFHLRARGLSGKALRRAEDQALERVAMGAHADRPIAALSKGYKRRAALAAAIAHEPPALILDEPTDGLDPNQKDGVRALIRELAPKTAILISTHLLDEVEAMCTRTLVIADGRLKADATPHDLARGSGGMAAAFRALTGADAAPIEAPAAAPAPGDAA